MTRAAVVVDRAARLVVAIVLAVGGAALLLWNTTVFDSTPEVITAPGLITASTTEWWPWTVTGLGIVLVLLSLRWLIAHRPTPSIGRIVPSRGDSGVTTTRRSDRLLAGRCRRGGAAARALAAYPSIGKASGSAGVDRRRRTLDVTATVAAPEVLADAVRAADCIAREAVTMLGDDTLAARTLPRIDTPTTTDTSAEAEAR